MMTPIRRERCGFTLMELIVVVMIIGILMSAIVPMFRSSIIGMKQDGAREEFLALLTYAHERSVMQSVEYRVYIDDNEGKYWVEAVKIPTSVPAEQSAGANDGEEGPATPELPPIDPTVFEPIDGPFGQPKRLPDPLEFDDPQTQTDSKRDLHFVAFYGSGACDEAKVVIADRTARKRMIITTDGRLGKFDVEMPRRR